VAIVGQPLSPGDITDAPSRRMSSLTMLRPRAAVRAAHVPYKYMCTHGNKMVRCGCQGRARSIQVYVYSWKQDGKRGRARRTVAVTHSFSCRAWHDQGTARAKLHAWRSTAVICEACRCTRRSVWHGRRLCSPFFEHHLLSLDVRLPVARLMN